MIQTNSLGSATLSADAAAGRLRNAPQWAISKINRVRSLRGLSPVVGGRLAAFPKRGPALVALHPARTIPAAIPAALPKIGFVLTGAAAGSTAGRIEAFADDAFDDWMARARRGSRSVDFVIRPNGHGSAATAEFSDGSIVFQNRDLVGPVCVWSPDAANAAHRAAVASISAGRDRCSVEIRVLAAEIIDDVRLITAVEFAGVAILRAGEKPAYGGSICGILSRNETEPAAMARLVQESLRRGWCA